jgi:threonine/homoserine/homoserine lactone efflux protein
LSGGPFLYAWRVESLFAFLAISGAIAVGAMSPGPSFLVVARAALAKGRNAALLTAAGMASAGALYALLAVVGLASLLTATPLVFATVKVLGAGYLAFIGYSMIRHSKSRLEATGGGFDTKSGFWVGFVTQVSNPKTIVVYTSVFAALLPVHAEPWLFGMLPLSIGVIEGGWYAIVAIVFAGSKASQLYARAKTAIDRISGAVMILLAIRLAWPA